MAKKKTKPTAADRHKHKTSVRLPEELHRRLKILAERNRRLLTEEAQIAIEEHLRRQGLWPPEEEGTTRGE